MKSKEFSIALNEIDDKYVTEALTYQCKKKSYRRKKRFYFKRVIVVAAILGVMFSGAIGVSAIRGPFFKMVKTVFSNHVELDFEGDKKEHIEEVYSITEIPKGFELTEEIINATAVFKDYENQEGNIISFSQMTTENATTVKIDNEHSTHQTVVVNELEIYVVESNRHDVTAAFWAADGYSFNLTYFGEIQIDFFTELISSVEIIQYY